MVEVTTALKALSEEIRIRWYCRQRRAGRWRARSHVRHFGDAAGVIGDGHEASSATTILAIDNIESRQSRCRKACACTGCPTNRKPGIANAYDSTRQACRFLHPHAQAGDDVVPRPCAVELFGNALHRLEFGLPV